MGEPEILPNRTVCRVELVEGRLSSTISCRARKRGSQSLQAVSRGAKEFSVYLRRSVGDSRPRSLLAYSSLLPTTSQSLKCASGAKSYGKLRHTAALTDTFVGPYFIVYTTRSCPHQDGFGRPTGGETSFISSEHKLEVIATAFAIGSINTNIVHPCQAASPGRHVLQRKPLMVCSRRIYTVSPFSRPFASRHFESHHN